VFAEVQEPSREKARWWGSLELTGSHPQGRIKLHPVFQNSQGNGIKKNIPFTRCASTTSE
jgi:hypothetical protein